MSAFELETFSPEVKPSRSNTSDLGLPGNPTKSAVPQPLFKCGETARAGPDTKNSSLPQLTWTPGRVQELVKLANHEPPLSLSEIERRLGITDTTIKRWLGKLGIEHNFRNSGSDTWTPERLEKLTKFFEEGLPTAEIGRRMGLSKNAIIGKLHRLALAPRQAPYEPSHDVFNGGGCLWPYGDPGTPGFRFCGHHELAITESGRRLPYCDRHASIAYRKPGEDAADE